MTWRVLGVVLTITTLGCARTRVPPAGARDAVVVHIAAFKFAPAEIVVGSRDSIAWVNGDDFAHTSTADAGAWTSPELPRGGRYVLRAPAPGRYAYHCAAHPTMKAVLEVRPEK